MSLPWIIVDTAATPDGKLVLQRRGERDYLITIDGRVLMNSMTHRSEAALGALACRGLAALDGPRVLVGGLGMAFTLRAVLAWACARLASAVRMSYPPQTAKPGRFTPQHPRRLLDPGEVRPTRRRLWRFIPSGFRRAVRGLVYVIGIGRSTCRSADLECHALPVFPRIHR